MLQYIGEFEEAMKIYDAILTENPVNLLVLKRKVLILIQHNTYIHNQNM
jgi:hypothetical protein